MWNERLSKILTEVLQRCWDSIGPAGHVTWKQGKLRLDTYEESQIVESCLMGLIYPD